jgi:hypothetical protein
LSAAAVAAVMVCTARARHCGRVHGHHALMPGCEHQQSANSSGSVTRQLSKLTHH